jgi:hypothetical protein
MKGQEKSEIKDAETKFEHHADRSVWMIWMGLVLAAVAILPFALRNSEVLRQIAAMCGFDIN